MDPLTIIVLIAFALMAVCWLTLPAKGTGASSAQSELSGSLPSPHKA